MDRRYSLEDFEPADASKIYASLWKRLLAFFFDASLMASIGFVLIYFFFDYLVGLESLGRLLGFGIALIYFGAMNSAVSGGQTLGKRLIKISTVNSEGGFLNPLQSSLRYMVVAIPFFLNGAIIDSETLATPWFIALLSVLVAGLFISIVYLFIFNRKTKQSLHDLIVGSYVINAIEPRVIEKTPIWKGHLAVVVVILLSSVFVPSLLVPELKGEKAQAELAEIEAAHAAIESMDEVRYVSVHSNKTDKLFTEQASQSMLTVSSQVILSKDVPDYDVFAEKLVQILISNYPISSKKDAINLSLSYGCDIGIASMWKSKKYSKRPVEWMKGGGVSI